MQRRGVFMAWALASLSGSLPAPLAAQILPPIYKPLLVEEGQRYRAAADSLRRTAADVAAQAEALEDGARSLRQNGSGVVEKLLAEAQRLTEQVSRLETQVRVDALTIDALQAQRADFVQRAIGREAVVFEARAALEASRLALPPNLAAASGVDASTDAQIRSDSLLAVAFRQQAEELSKEAANLAGGIAAARHRIIGLQQQEQLLRDYVTDIASGNSANEPTAVRLEAEARVLRRNVERLIQEERTQTELAEELRVQANRRVMPVRSRVEAMRFYGEDGRAVLRTLVFSLGDGGRAGSINSELVSDYAGPVRFGVGFVLAEARGTEDAPDGESAPSSNATALERFYAGGGNFVVYSTLPVIFHRSPYHSLTLQTLNKVAVDVPGARYRGSAAEVPVNLDLGVEAYWTFNTYQSRIKAFGLVRSALAVGNQPFYRNIGRARGALPYAQATLGAEIASVAKVLISGARASEELGRELTLTFQVAR